MPIRFKFEIVVAFTGSLDNGQRVLLVLGGLIVSVTSPEQAML